MQSRAPFYAASDFTFRIRVSSVAWRTRATSNGNGTHHTALPSMPAPAETARTIVDICNEGVLSTLGEDGFPVGTPVAFQVDKQTGAPSVHLGPVELRNLGHDGRCSLQVQSNLMPARAVASITLVGRVNTSESGKDGAHTLAIDRCLYFGGLDQASSMCCNAGMCLLVPNDGQIASEKCGQACAVSAGI
jgi:hypothetical protein